MEEVSKQYFRSQGRKITQTDDMVRVVLDMSIIEYCNTIKKTKNGAMKQEPTLISVNDRLPEEKKHVLLYFEDVKCSFVGYIVNGAFEVCFCDWYVEYHKVTGWMPLPEPPKEGE